MKNASQIRELARSTTTASALLAALTEETALSKGQACYMLGKGSSSVQGTFQGFRGAYALVDVNGKEQTTMPHLVFPA